MKRIMLMLLVSGMIASCASTETKKPVVSAASSDMKSGYGRPVTVFDYTLHEYGAWTAHVDDADDYNCDLYFTLNDDSYDDSNSIIYFYYSETSGDILEDIIKNDKNNFYEEYPGIKITDYEIGNVDYSQVDKRKVKGNFADKKFFTVVYDFSNVTVKHPDQYQIVVFFKFNSDVPYFCVLELASTDDEAFKYVEDLKKIYMAVSENPEETDI